MSELPLPVRDKMPTLEDFRNSMTDQEWMFKYCNVPSPESVSGLSSYSWDFRHPKNDNVNVNGSEVIFCKSCPDGLMVMLPNKDSTVMKDIARTIQEILDKNSINEWRFAQPNFEDLHKSAIICKLPSDRDVKI